ncbi:MAG TPA: hypothetical protein VJK48_00995, partial [Chlamydiales bacterium]|nr:hypothetical protein [Chlamydiales bacterium]
MIPFCLQIGPEDREGYELLKKENSEMHAKSAINELPVVQLRQGTRKDLWKMQEGSMRHYQLFSENSRLTLTQKRKRFESVETFDEAYGSKGSEFAFSAASGYVDKETFFLEGDLELTLEIDGKLSTACADSASFNKEESKL